MKQLPWQHKRSAQGYSYHQVVKELKRRAAGNYLFSQEENSSRLAVALAKVELLYKLSATLHDFRKECAGLGVLELLEEGMLGESLGIMMDPFPVGDKSNSIALDEFVDEMYPGLDYAVERDEEHTALSLNKKTAS